MNEVLIFILGLVTNFYGISIGGGGLLLIPGLILLGVDPKIVIGSTSVANIASSVVGIINFHKAKQIDYKHMLPFIIEITAGAIIGSLLVINMPTDYFVKSIAVVLIIMTILSLKNRNIGLIEKAASATKKTIGHVLLFFCGIYKGAVNSGSSLPVSYILIFNFGMTYLKASGSRKIPMLISYIPSALLFIWSGLIDWKLVLILVASNSIGAHYGSKFMLKKGNTWMQYGFSIIVILTVIKMLF